MREHCCFADCRFPLLLSLLTAALESNPYSSTDVAEPATLPDQSQTAAVSLLLIPLGWTASSLPATYHLDYFHRTAVSKSRGTKDECKAHKRVYIPQLTRIKPKEKIARSRAVTPREERTQSNNFQKRNAMKPLNIRLASKTKTLFFN